MEIKYSFNFSRVTTDVVFTAYVSSLVLETMLSVSELRKVKVSTSLTNIGSLAVGAFDLVDCSLSVVRFVS